MNSRENEICRKILKEFGLNGIQEIEQVKSGNINTTYVATNLQDNAKKRYILQKINTNVFRRPYQVMENIVSVCDYLQKANAKKYGTAHRRCMVFLRTADGEPFYESAELGFWRCCEHIENATAYDKVEKAEHFESAGAAFGEFQRMLAGFESESLHETIPGFHHTKSRLETFKKDLETDAAGRAESTQQEIREILQRENTASYVLDMMERGEIPIRVTHNDTKLNNIMIDDESGEGICVIDLDTIMPGTALFDFGDAIRFGANHTYEDDPDLEEVYLDLDLFEAFTRGFLGKAKGRLTDKEIENLAAGAVVITYEQALRFLDDYINGDTYFKINSPEHNLVRARNQIRLLQDMEQKYGKMREIVEKYRN